MIADTKQQPVVATAFVLHSGQSDTDRSWNAASIFFVCSRLEVYSANTHSAQLRLI